jgi:hypothetical protein
MSPPQAQSKVLPDGGSVDIKFKGVFQAFTRSVQRKGGLNLWNGLTPTLIRVSWERYKHMLVNFVIFFDRL